MRRFSLFLHGELAARGYPAVALRVKRRTLPRWHARPVSASVAVTAPKRWFQTDRTSAPASDTLPSSPPSAPPHPSATTSHASAGLPTLSTLRDAVSNGIKRRFQTLLEDRRAAYRDSVVTDVIAPHRAALRQALADFLASDVPPGSSDAAVSVAALTRAQIRSWKAAWLARIKESTGAMTEQQEDGQATVHTTLQFYEVLLATDAVAHIDDTALVLDELRSTDFLEPHAGVYQSILWSLPVLHLSKPSASLDGRTAVAPPLPQRVVGEVVRIDRVALGDAACRYMGHAVAKQRDDARRLDHALPASLAPTSDRLWAAFFTLATITHMSPTLFDLWWSTFLDPFQPRITSVRLEAAEDDTASGPALPFSVAYAGVAWCAGSQDVERAMRLFKQCNARGLSLESAANEATDGATATSLTLQPGSLVQRHASSEWQAVQLRLFVKMLSTVKSTRFDGGVREVFVKDIKALIRQDVLRDAPWGVINDLMSALSVPSAMQLVQLRCAPKQAEAAPPLDTAQRPQDEKAPFFVWASLLRRCAKAHCLDEAESLFAFINQTFFPACAEKRELVEIMMRMYATLSPPDYASAATVFLEHVLRTPEGQSPVVADADLYNLLITAADSRNAAMMVFLEACADGVAMNASTFEALVNASPHSTMASLSRKLPHDYSVSSLDRQMRIPANVDAHARREEALRARNKPMYDSTGDSG